MMTGMVLGKSMFIPCRFKGEGATPRRSPQPPMLRAAVTLWLCHALEGLETVIAKNIDGGCLQCEMQL